jgi:jumonji domain-containing protein 7
MLDAVNLWIGNSRSVTALHRDNYENIYVQIIGEKRFVLLSPVEVGCVGEKLFPSASYTVRYPSPKSGADGSIYCAEPL